MELASQPQVTNNDSQSYKSEEDDDDDDLASSQHEEADQDSILDSVSNDEDDKSESFEVESEWSELDFCFADLDDVYEELSQQNEQHPPERQVNIDDVIDAMRRERETAKELIKQFGTVAAVVLYRSSKHGSTFDKDLYRALDQRINAQLREPIPLVLKNKVSHFVHRLCEVVCACFQKLKDDTETKESRISLSEAYRFLSMLDKVLPVDQKKLRRITIEKTIPNLIKLTRELEELSSILDDEI